MDPTTAALEKEHEAVSGYSTLANTYSHDGSVLVHLMIRGEPYCNARLEVINPSLPPLG